MTVLIIVLVLGLEPWVLCMLGKHFSELQLQLYIFIWKCQMALTSKPAPPTLAALNIGRAYFPCPLLQKYLPQKSISSITIYCHVLLSGSEKPHGKSQCYTC
jgi:hypothetical protein